MANTPNRKTSRGVGTTPTKIGGYDIPASTTAIVIGCSICNVGSIATAITVEHYDGTNSTRIVKDMQLPLGETFIVDQKTSLVAGDSIRVTTGSGGSVDCVMSLMEFTP